MEPIVDPGTHPPIFDLDPLSDAEDVYCDMSKGFEIEWRCLECGENLGPMNPRQLCGKTKCTGMKDMKNTLETLCYPGEDDGDDDDVESDFSSDLCPDIEVKLIGGRRMQREFSQRWPDDRLLMTLGKQFNTTSKYFKDGYEDEYPPPSPPSLKEFKSILQRRIEDDIAVTYEEAALIRSIPQHDSTGEASEDWLAARKFRITGTAAAGGMGVQYPSTPKFLKGLIWGMSKEDQGNPALKWGNSHEADADAAFKTVMAHLHAEKKMEFSYPGLCINAAQPYLAMSPDGILFMDDRYHLVEYKCPYSLSGESKRSKSYHQLPFELYLDDENRLWKKRFDKSWPVKNLYPTSGEKKRRKKSPYLPTEFGKMPMPQYYYTQVVHGMYTIDHCRLSSTYFVVWAPMTSEKVKSIYKDEFDAEGKQTAYGIWSTPHGTVQITHVPLDMQYANTQRSMVADFYYKEYLPMMVLKEEGFDEYVSRYISTRKRKRNKK